jgi:hypothetical protein
MLLSKEIEVELSSRNIKNYENLGYIIPRIKDKQGRMRVAKGTMILVKVEDLTDGSIAYVDVKCDGCGKILHKQWINYKQHVHKDGKYYCKRCGTQLLGSKKMRQTKLTKSESFGYWLIKNLPLRQAVEIIARWDYKKNDCDIREVCYSAEGFNRKGYWFKCLLHPEHESELKNISHFTSGYKGCMKCKACNSIGQYICDTYGNDKLNYYWDWYKNGEILDPFKIDKGSHKIVYIYCQEHSYHGSYPIKCNDFYNGNRCGYCATIHGKVHPFDSLGYYIINNYGEKFLDKIWSEKNKKSPFEYTPFSNIKGWFKCVNEIHKDYKRSINDSTRRNFRCADCVQEMNESTIQNKIRLYLESLNESKYIILHEYKCTIISQNPKMKNKRGQMPYDNEIIINNKHLIIEVHGSQHYALNGWHQLLAKKHNTTPAYEFHMQKLRDRYKKFIAYKQGYEYLAISYKDIENNENYKDIINNKLNEILKYKEVS